MERYIPITSSLIDNAPGYSPNTFDDRVILSNNNLHIDNTSSDTDICVGPICWKCDGTGEVKHKTTIILCKVCNGHKRMKVKQLNRNMKHDLVTKQTIPNGWIPKGPKCVSSQDDNILIPSNVELCVLVGEWRIFQRIGGHRWTTDDLVTSWIAGRVIREHHIQPFNYLDLGCGNGSVLLMTAWQFPTTSCIGLEARIEAVELAHSSIQYNCGIMDERIQVKNHDFRCIYDRDDNHDQNILPDNIVFEIITGTPPYFKIDFKIETNDSINKNISNNTNHNNGNNNTTTTTNTTITNIEAFIREGGMPTCKESAPARCEFRGGIEVYCLAASKILSSNGIFTVCENYLNHNRVLKAAINADLIIFRIQRVIGKIGKLPLFCVYCMKQNNIINHMDDIIAIKSEEDIEFEDDLIVRDENGAWTLQYVEIHLLLDYEISVPARCEFGGGIEVYCLAASKILSSNGIFDVCENYLNHNRVLKAAINADLIIFRT